MLMLMDHGGGGLCMYFIYVHLLVNIVSGKRNDKRAGV